MKLSAVLVCAGSLRSLAHCHDWPQLISSVKYPTKHGTVKIEIREEPDLPAAEFLDLANAVWPRDYDPAATAAALTRTINIVARADGALIGTLRILTDGYFFGTVPEILVHPKWQRRGIGRALLAAGWDRSPTGLYFGAQPGNEPFFERSGFERGLQSYARRKPRGVVPGRSERTIDVES